jgi:DnaK suppressor protein
MMNIPIEVQDDRYVEIAKMLAARRRDLLNDLRDRKRDARDVSMKELDVRDDGEISEADTQEEIEFALLEMKADMLSRITTALHRLADGTYGQCLDCGDDIAAQRLKALPFALRCKSCEEARESAERLERIASQQRRQPADVTYDVTR